MCWLRPRLFSCCFSVCQLWTSSHQLLSTEVVHTMMLSQQTWKYGHSTRKALCLPSLVAEEFYRLISKRVFEVALNCSSCPTQKVFRARTLNNLGGMQRKRKEKTKTTKDQETLELLFFSCATMSFLCWKKREGGKVIPTTTPCELVVNEEIHLFILFGCSQPRSLQLIHSLNLFTYFTIPLVPVPPIPYSYWNK